MTTDSSADLLRDVVAHVREWFLQEDAACTARDYTSDQVNKIAECSAAATKRATLAEELSGAETRGMATSLLRDAIRLRLEAISIARGSDTSLIDALGNDDDATRVASVMGQEGLALEELARDPTLRRSLERIERRLRHGVVAHTMTYLRGLRVGRMLAVFVVVMWVSLRVASAAFDPPNLAFHKRVSVSSIGSLVSPETLVDGQRSTFKPFMTRVDPAPWATIDLGGVFAVERIRIFNREDRSLDAVLPFDVESSIDGVAYQLITTQRDHFRDITIKADRHARFIRVRCERATALTLNEIEIYGRYVGGLT